MMGSRDDPRAVVDSEGNVLGLEGLRVVDASTMPFLVRANAHIPVLMIAEKLADAMLRRD
jgi:choline dehydrogenase-like flavoprotein